MRGKYTGTIETVMNGNIQKSLIFFFPVFFLSVPVSPGLDWEPKGSNAKVKLHQKTVILTKTRK